MSASNDSPKAQDDPADSSRELRTILSSFGVRPRVVVPADRGQEPLRLLVQGEDDAWGQLRVYPANAELSKRLVESAVAHAHLLGRSEKRLLRLQPGPDGDTLTRGDAHYLYLPLPTGVRPMPPAWNLTTMVQLGTCLGEIGAVSVDFLDWKTVPTNADWQSRIEGRVERTERVADESSGLLAALPDAVAARIRPAAAEYCRMAEADVEAARALVSSYESAIWDAAGSRSFVLHPPPPTDFFVRPEQEILVAWPEQIKTGLRWDGWLGEVARGQVNGDLNTSLACLEAANRVWKTSADALALLPIAASPVQSYLNIVESAVADAPVEREDLLLRLIEATIGNPRRADLWRRELCERLQAQD